MVINPAVFCRSIDLWTSSQPLARRWSGLRSCERPAMANVEAVLRQSGENSQAAEAAGRFLRVKRSQQEARAASREMALVAASMADAERAEDEQRDRILEAARARAARAAGGAGPTVRTSRIYVISPAAGQPLISLRIRATDTAADLIAALEARCGLAAGSHRLTWDGKAVTAECAAAEYRASSVQPFRLLPVATTASRSRLQALARAGPPADLKPTQTCDEPSRAAPRTPAAVASPRLVQLSTPRAVRGMPADTTARRARSKPCSPARLHELAQPTLQRAGSMLERSRPADKHTSESPPISLRVPSDGVGTANAAAATTEDTAEDAAEDAATLSFINDAVALAKALMGEGMRADLPPEQRRICCSDAVDSMLQAVEVARQTRSLSSEEVAQLERMLVRMQGTRITPPLAD
jgi:hypothetical protein